MFTVSFITDILALVALVLAGLLLQSYLPTYFREKGKNRATKEDVEEISNKIEEIRSQYTRDQELLRSQLQERSDVLEKRRELYEDVVSSLHVFVSGPPADDQQKRGFLEAYSTLWLWAPDSVVNNIKDLLDLHMALAKDPKAVDQETLKQAYMNCVLEMRRTAGFPYTQLDHQDYRFVCF
jgi:hypothetical protein